MIFRGLEASQPNAQRHQANAQCLPNAQHQCIIIGNIFVSNYQLTHQASHLGIPSRRKIDFTKVTPEVQ